jgi:nicotinamide mononucleotide transporter
MAWIEVIAVVFGLLCVWLSIRQNIWCWPTGLVQVVLFLVIFYHAKLYSDLVLHGIYVLLQVYGWYSWLHGGSERRPLGVTRLPACWLAGWVVVALAGTAAWGTGMATFTDAAVPYWDAFTTVASLVAQWLLTRKRLESWYFWIAVDIVAIGVYWYKSLFLTAGLYSIFLFMAIAGFVVWRKSLLAGLQDERSDENRADVGEVRSVPQGTPEVD